MASRLAQIIARQQAAPSASAGTSTVPAPRPADLTATTSLSEPIRPKTTETANSSAIGTV